MYYLILCLFYVSRSVEGLILVCLLSSERDFLLVTFLFGMCNLCMEYRVYILVVWLSLSTCYVENEYCGWAESR